jgi:predicted porin
MLNSRLLAKLGVIAAALTATGAYAQSSVTLYGIADVSVRYITNDNANNDGRLFMTNGAISNSRWGMKGSEDLGGGLSAIFRLESGIELNNGQGDGALFNRSAYVGLSSNQWGTLTAGRQYSPLFDQLSNTFDPLTVGNYDQNEWLPVALSDGMRFNNTVKYNGTFSGLNVEAMYGFGNQAGSVGAGSTYALSAAYTLAGLSVDAGYQQIADTNNNHQKIVNLGAVYAFNTVHAYAGWIYSKDNTGAVDTLMWELSDASAPNGGHFLTGTGRIDNGFYAGAAWQATAPLTLTAAAYYDRMKNALETNGTLGDGNRLALVGVAEYALSKRTEVYGTVDYNRGNGAATANFPGRNNQTGVAIGFRNIF